MLCIKMLTPTAIFCLIVINISFSAGLTGKQSEAHDVLNKQKEGTKSIKHGIHDFPHKIRKKTHRNEKNKSMQVDGITHFEIEIKGVRKLNKNENRFKNALTMRGVNFIYKRDMFWRTWREVRLSNGSKTTVFYKCTHIINSTCENCHGGGFWKVDEEVVPCPYEILSMVNRNEICVVNYTHINNINKPCPSVSSLDELIFSCDDPIITLYRFTNMFTSERDDDICRGREKCDISTFYRVNNDYVIFRIMNSKNDVIYSKVMRHDKRNYACSKDCGHFDPKTEKFFNGTSTNSNKNKWTKYQAKPKRIHHKRRKTTVSPCSKLQTTTEDYLEDIYGDMSLEDIINSGPPHA